MKKLLLIAALLAALLVLTGCGCKHEHTELHNVVNATCTEAGFSGDTYCLDCKKIIKKGETVEALGHTEGTLRDAYDPTCYTNGYTGDLCCERCGLILERGTSIPAKDHVPADERSGVREATCTITGYTGDIVCAECGASLEYGERIDLLPHTRGETDNAVEPTCTSEGYTGDTTCTVCGENIRGEAIPKLEHTFGEDGKCVNCGWMASGLYLDGKLELTWAELTEGGYVTVKDGTLQPVANGLMGTLVVDEEVTKVRDRILGESAITEVWLPCTIRELTRLTFYEAKNLKTVKFFGGFEYIGDQVFAGCSALEAIDLPVGITGIPDSMFRGCASLKRIELPDTVTEIGKNAFEDCTALTEVVFPEECAITLIDYKAFRKTGLTGMTLPASVTELGANAFSACASLTSVDLSQTQITELSGTFTECPLLSDVQLPSTLTYMWDIYFECPLISTVEIPEGVTEYFSGYNSYMDTVIWPTSLLTGKGFNTSVVELKTIHYRGSELKWNLVSDKPEWMSGVAVDFNYAE